MDIMVYTTCLGCTSRVSVFEVGVVKISAGISG